VRAVAVTGFVGSATFLAFDVSTLPVSPMCRYDDDNSGTIEKDEAVAAVVDYLLQLGDSILSRQNAVDIVTAYLLQQQFTCPT
jgi:hypothetical protein